MPRRAALELPVPGFARVAMVGVAVTRGNAVVEVAVTTGIMGGWMVRGTDWVGAVKVEEGPDVWISRGRSSDRGGDEA